MQGIGNFIQKSMRYVALLVVFMLSGCSLLFPDSGPVNEQPIAIVAPPAVAPFPRKRVAPPELPAVAIVLTSRQPAYADVASELTEHFKDFEIYDLSDRSEPPVSVLRRINDSNSRAVVAVGLRAAQSSVAMAEMPVIFAQVFNYQDHDLLSSTSRGIAALPPLDAQLSAWKNIDPTIKRIGAILGEGHEDLIADAKVAAQRYDMEIEVRISHSDQETLYFFRRMIRDIDGFWLFPDNRILSGRVLQQMLHEANRQHVPVVVPNESMLAMGADISMSTVASDIAKTIVKVVRQIQAGNLEQVPPISELSEILIKTNDAIQVADR